MEEINIYNSNRFPVKSASDSLAEQLRKSIVERKDSLPASVTGRIRYISPLGDDSSDGSKEHPWKTVKALEKNADGISAGDAVLFERGGIFRGNIRAKGGVYYGAYGEGKKPEIYGSAENYANAEWREAEPDIWTCGELSADAGIVVFNGGELIGFKKHEKEDLKQNGDFWCDGFVYYMYSKGNPAELWQSIEIGVRTAIFGMYDSPVKNITVENLCFKYGGGHAVSACSGEGAVNITVRGCEIGFIGGSYLSGRTRFGNAIEFYGPTENAIAEKNLMYQIYDSGLTFQGGESFAVKNVRFADNLIEYCGMGSFEYWLAYNSANGVYNYADDVLFENNICRFAGYCWGGYQRPDKVSSHILSNGANQNRITNYVIRNNIFDCSTHDLIEITSLDGTYPEMQGNTYIQTKGMRLGSFADSRDIEFGDNVKEVLEKEWGEEKPEIIYCDPVGEADKA